jgi:hypothetical protein
MILEYSVEPLDGVTELVGVNETVAVVVGVIVAV